MIVETPVTFTNHGQQLVGMIHAPEGTCPCPAVLFHHGFTGNRIEAHFLFVKMARRLAAAGFLAMRFDFRGSGESAGDFREMTIPGEIDDAKAALAWLRGHPMVDPDRVTLLGLSMGGAVASVVAGEDERIVALVLWSALSDPADVVRRSAEGSGSMPSPLGLQPDGGFDIGGHLLGLEFLTTIEQARPLDSLMEFRRPALILHGSADEVIPPSHADRFLETIGEQHATRHWIQGADHTYSAHVWEEEVFQLTADWLRGVAG